MFQSQKITLRKPKELSFGHQQLRIQNDCLSLSLLLTVRTLVNIDILLHCAHMATI